jgi:hypothetical protein
LIGAVPSSEPDGSLAGTKVTAGSAAKPVRRARPVKPGWMVADAGRSSDYGGGMLGALPAPNAQPSTAPGAGL